MIFIFFFKICVVMFIFVLVGIYMGEGGLSRKVFVWILILVFFTRLLSFFRYSFVCISMCFRFFTGSGDRGRSCFFVFFLVIVRRRFFCCF